MLMGVGFNFAIPEAPLGWDVRVRIANNLAIYSRIATANEPSSYTVTGISPDSSISGIILAYRHGVIGEISGNLATTLCPELTSKYFGSTYVVFRSTIVVNNISQYQVQSPLRLRIQHTSLGGLAYSLPMSLCVATRDVNTGLLANMRIIHPEAVTTETSIAVMINGR